MSATARLVVATILLAAVHLAVSITRSGATPTHVELSTDLRSLPLQLGEWTGEATTLDPRIAVATGGEYTVNRLYRGPGGQVVALHIVAITNYGAEGVHHFPKYCMLGAGYSPRSTEFRQLQMDNGRSIPANFSLWARGDERSAVAYWYHFGDKVVFFEIDEFRRAQREYWGATVWPPVVKVLLQAPASASGQIPPHLQEFATLVAEWTSANLSGGSPKG